MEMGFCSLTYTKNRIRVPGCPSTPATLTPNRALLFQCGRPVVLKIPARWLKMKTLKTHQTDWVRICILGLPWWRSGWESACQCRGHGFEPWSGKISHAAEQLGPWATITEPARLEPVLCNKRGRDSERPAHHDEEWPPFATTRESPRTETKTQHSHK